MFIPVMRPFMKSPARGAATSVHEAEAKILALGATRLPSTEEGFRVYADPAGHPFCLGWS